MIHVKPNPQSKGNCEVASVRHDCIIFHTKAGKTIEFRGAAGMRRLRAALSLVVDDGPRWKGKEPA
jgi:hypothetical protein